MKNIDVEEFIKQAIEHGEATSATDPKRANRAHDKLICALRVLKQKDIWLETLIPLLNHTNDSVRVWTATYLLPHEEQKALRILEEISSGQGFCAFDAGIIVQEWQAGRLKLLVE